MPTTEIQERRGFTDLLSQLSDSDLVVEVTSAPSGPKTPDGSSVQRVQEAVEASYRALAGAAPVHLETVAVLEELAKRSVSLWFRAHVPTAGGEGPENSPLKFLARGMLAIIAWMDGSPTLQLADLQQAIRVLAWGTSITTTAHPALPSSAELVEAVTAWQRAKASFTGEERVRIVTSNGSADLDLSKRIADPRTLLQARKLVNHSTDMIFVVEMPDYEANGQWRLKHGGTHMVALSEPGTLLDKFYRRELDIRPGDALRCKVDFETSYGPDHEVLAERYRIVEIMEVLPPTRADHAAGSPTSDRMPARHVSEELEAADS